MTDLSRKRDRERLSVRREPYWQRLEQGAYLGFRRGPNTWVARYRNRDGKQVYNALNAAEYDDAKKAAEAWFAQLGAAPVRSARRGTVKEALETYLAYLREQGRDAAEKNCKQRFKATVYKDPLADIPLQKLTRDDMREWRERLRKGRQPRTVNRLVRNVVAGLNRALAEGHVGKPETWKLEALADDVDDGGETAVMLTPAQRAALIAACVPAAAAFCRGLELTGARPGELAIATAKDFDGKAGILRLQHRKGRPAKLRVRAVVLSVEGVTFFKAQATDKLPPAPLFTDPAGKLWDRHEWAFEIRQAVAAHNEKASGKKRIPAGATAYSFRHARISELLQVHGVDPLTVAAQTGTSVRMIEKAYFKSIPDALRDKLAAIEEA